MAWNSGSGRVRVAAETGGFGSAGSCRPEVKASLSFFCLCLYINPLAFALDLALLFQLKEKIGYFFLVVILMLAVSTKTLLQSLKKIILLPPSCVLFQIYTLALPVF